MRHRRSETSGSGALLAAACRDNHFWYARPPSRPVDADAKKAAEKLKEASEALKAFEEDGEFIVVKTGEEKKKVFADVAEEMATKCGWKKEAKPEGCQDGQPKSRQLFTHF